MAEGVWLRRAGAIHAATVPKGYASEIGRLMVALARDPAWQVWWSHSGYDYLHLYLAYQQPNTREFLGTGTRFQRKGDYVESTFRSIFEHFDQQRWSVDQSRQEARRRMAAFFALAGQRLKAGPPPPLPE